MNCVLKSRGDHEAELRGYLRRQLANARQAEELRVVLHLLDKSRIYPANTFKCLTGEKT
jgi:hypothetical protein